MPFSWKYVHILCPRRIWVCSLKYQEQSLVRCEGRRNVDPPERDPRDRENPGSLETDLTHEMPPSLTYSMGLGTIPSLLCSMSVTPGTDDG